MMLPINHKKWTVTLNILAEFLASILFSLLYFIFISRYLSSNFNISYPALSLEIGLAFFAAIYIPFHTYRIHVLPFISIINALRNKSWRMLWNKIPAQIVGSFIGVIIFRYVNDFTTHVDIEDIQSITLKDSYIVAFFNACFTALICYVFYIIRILVRARKMFGTILLGAFVSFLFILFGRISGLSSINPFGLFFYDILEKQTILNLPWYNILLIHILAPISASVFVFYRMKNYLIKPKPVEKLVEPEYQNYDI